MKGVTGRGCIFGRKGPVSPVLGLPVGSLFDGGDFWGGPAATAGGLGYKVGPFALGIVP